MKTRKAWKLVRVMADGTFASLFINKRDRLPIGKWLKAHCYPTKGFKVRPGWHCTPRRHAPHLGTEGRAWVEVEIRDYTTELRPEAQGGLWYLAQEMRLTGTVVPA